MRRANKLVLVLAFALAPVALYGGSPQVNVPDWVKSLASQVPGTYPPRTNAVVLLDETTISVANPTEYVETRRRVVRILRPEGRNEGSFRVHFGRDDKVNNVHAWSIDAAGRQYEVKDKDFPERGVFGDEFYNDSRMRSAEVPAPDVGSVVAFESSVKRRLWIAQPTWFFQEDIPVKEAHYTLDLPAGWEYKATWANAKPQAPVQVGPNKWQWAVSNVAGIVEEQRQPNPASLAGRLELAYFGSGVAMPVAASWKSIGQWYNTLTADRRKPTPEIENNVRGLTAGLAGFDAIARALTVFLQNEVRYVAIEIGIGGHQPHFAADVYRNRYGDCKDKTTLLSTMLQVAGIHSYYVVIHTEHGIVRADVPAMTFNHVVLAIELPKDAPEYRSIVTARSGKRLLIFDPTDSYTPMGELPAYLQGNVGMLVTEDGGEAITLPIMKPDHNRLERTGKFVLSADGGLAGEVVEKRTGQNASYPRHAMLNLSERERTQYMERFLGASLNGGILGERTIENLKDRDKELMFRYKLTTAKYAQNAGSLVLVRPRVLGAKSFAIDWKDRKYPVELDSSSQETDAYEIQLPDGYVVDDVPQGVTVDVGFATYKSRIEAAGATVKYFREYVIKDPWIPLEKLGDLRRLEDTIGQDEFASVVLKKK